jgi:hypothetical protein
MLECANARMHERGKMHECTKARHEGTNALAPKSLCTLHFAFCILHFCILH